MNQPTWQIPKKILDETSTILSSKNAEVFVLWTAPINMTDNIFRISRCVFPKQDAGFNFGAYVHIDGNELSRIVFDNYEKGERSVVQIHTHPSKNVEMSLLDRKWEVVNHVGALSMIVPSYNKDKLNGFSGVNIYERETNDWRLWTSDETKKRLIIV
ncbi:MAG: hypothetical protein KGH99_05930 [Thaumarchaeota archaeon]|nr:hypothetical protein [Nitrososphaerota archaeon]